MNAKTFIIFIVVVIGLFLGYHYFMESGGVQHVYNMAQNPSYEPLLTFFEYIEMLREIPFFEIFVYLYIVLLFFILWRINTARNHLGWKIKWSLIVLLLGIIGIMLYALFSRRLGEVDKRLDQGPRIPHYHETERITYPDFASLPKKQTAKLPKIKKAKKKKKHIRKIPAPPKI